MHNHAQCRFSASCTTCKTDWNSSEIEIETTKLQISLEKCLPYLTSSNKSTCNWYLCCSFVNCSVWMFRRSWTNLPCGTKQPTSARIGKNRSPITTTVSQHIPFSVAAAAYCRILRLISVTILCLILALMTRFFPPYWRIWFRWRQKQNNEYN